METFTTRQLDVAFGLARGWSFPRIAQELGVSARSVKQSADQLRFKTGARTAREVPAALLGHGVNVYPREA